MSHDLKGLSKRAVTVNDGLTTENIKLSCLMRIADASERMAVNFISIEEDRDWYKKRYAETIERVSQRDRQISNLRGQITKLKNKLKTQNQ